MSHCHNVTYIKKHCGKNFEYLSIINNTKVMPKNVPTLPVRNQGFELQIQYI